MSWQKVSDPQCVARTGAISLVIEPWSRDSAGGNFGDREIFWNVVSSRAEKIEQAKQKWRDGRFERLQGYQESVPLLDAQ